MTVTVSGIGSSRRESSRESLLRSGPPGPSSDGPPPLEASSVARTLRPRSHSTSSANGMDP
eukprot:1191206-Prorocentrum_minimum.AAC.1